MKIVVATDSFKGSLSSQDAGNAIRDGLQKADPSAEILVIPVADGGEGTTDALIGALNGTVRTVCVTGPYGDPFNASYGLVPEQRMAVMEMASAAGITLCSRREPLCASTFGVGEMIRDAIAQGCRNFLLGIGGSATNDGGTGMLTALGYQFFDQEGAELPPIAASLGKIAKIGTDQVLSALKGCRFQIACDVRNPLCGPQGCTSIFGPQKGVSEAQIPELDSAMQHYAEIVAQTFHADNSQVPGAGAAGGLGFAFLSFLHGTLRPGIDLVLETVKLEETLQDADLVITGEGALDGQTIFGKTPVGVAARAKKYQVPVIALAGCIRPGAELCNQHGIDAFFPIVPGITTLEEAMQPQTAWRNLSHTAQQVLQLVLCFL